MFLITLYSNMQALSVEGRCKTFDDSADGYARGEAFAVACLARSGASAWPMAILQVRYKSFS